MSRWYLPSPKLTTILEDHGTRIVWRRKASGQKVVGELIGDKFHIREVAE